MCHSWWNENLEWKSTYSEKYLPTTMLHTINPMTVGAKAGNPKWPHLGSQAGNPTLLDLGSKPRGVMSQKIDFFVSLNVFTGLHWLYSLLLVENAKCTGRPMCGAGWHHGVECKFGEVICPSVVAHHVCWSSAIIVVPRAASTERVTSSSSWKPSVSLLW